MEFKVKEVASIEEKSSQQIEQDLVEKHEQETKENIGLMYLQQSTKVESWIETMAILLLLLI